MYKSDILHIAAENLFSKVHVHFSQIIYSHVILMHAGSYIKATTCLPVQIKL